MCQNYAVIIQKETSKEDEEEIEMVGGGEGAFLPFNHEYLAFFRFLVERTTMRQGRAACKGISHPW